MAHGYLQQFAGNKAQVYSAGIEAHGINSQAVQIMAEDGIDISGHTSNIIDEYGEIQFDFVITVCDHASEHCPIFPNATIRFHQNFFDPSKVIGTEMEVHRAFEQTRNQIKSYCQQWVNENL